MAKKGAEVLETAIVGLPYDFWSKVKELNGTRTPIWDWCESKKFGTSLSLVSAELQIANETRVVAVACTSTLAKMGNLERSPVGELNFLGTTIAIISGLEICGGGRVVNLLGGAVVIPVGTSPEYGPGLYSADLIPDESNKQYAISLMGIAGQRGSLEVFKIVEQGYSFLSQEIVDVVYKAIANKKKETKETGRRMYGWNS